VKPGVRCSTVSLGCKGLESRRCWISEREGRKGEMYKQDPHGTKKGSGLAEQKSMARGA